MVATLQSDMVVYKVTWQLMVVYKGSLLSCMVVYEVTW